MARRDETPDGITQRSRVRADVFVSDTGTLVDASGNQISLVSGDGGAPIVADLAALLAISSPTDGMVRRTALPVIGSVEAGGVPYLQWDYSAVTGWRLTQPSLLFWTTTPASGVDDTAEQVLLSLPVAPNLWTRLRQHRIKPVWAKSGASATATVRVRYGAAGSLSDPFFAPQTTFSARQMVPDYIGYMMGPTTRRVTFGPGVGGASVGQVSGNSFPTENAVADVGGQNTLTLSISLSTAAETPTLANVFIWGE